MQFTPKKFKSREPTAPEIKLRTDWLVGALLVAFTALPSAIRWPDSKTLCAALSFDFYLFDAVANIIGFVPLGLVLAGRGWRRALLFGGLLSAGVEIMQFFSVGRTPGLADVVANVAGTGAGMLIAAKWRLRLGDVAVTGPVATAAAIVAVAYVLSGGTLTAEGPLQTLRAWTKASPWMRTNPSGANPNGAIEAHYSFERADGGVVSDTSRNQINGKALGRPALLPGALGSALSLNGNQWVDLGDPVALRLTGSMTLSAWVKPTAFPVDDAAIISSLTDNELGYQLDVTVDQGPRTIGLKIANSSRELMARYGKTLIVTGRWYHIAGVYDAVARALHVYLNGRLDDGCLIGTISERQQPSGGHVTIGRRAGLAGFEFIGEVDEAEIQSRANTATEIANAFARTREVAEPSLLFDASDEDQRLGANCKSYLRPLRVAGPFMTLGMLIATACAGFRSRRWFTSASLSLCLFMGAAAMRWSPGAAAFDPIWLAPLYTLGGGIAVIVAGRLLAPSRAPS